DIPPDLLFNISLIFIGKLLSTTSAYAAERGLYETEPVTTLATASAGTCRWGQVWELGMRRRKSITF
ncbi:MAG TPA: hypothetical protein VFK23_02795, partial [Nitrospirota bacterium]|nr:hypothetical protein [Nitrospirota bacterium]